MNVENGILEKRIFWKRIKLYIFGTSNPGCEILLKSVFMSNLMYILENRSFDCMLLIKIYNSISKHFDKYVSSLYTPKRFFPLFCHSNLCPEKLKRSLVNKNSCKDPLHWSSHTQTEKYNMGGTQTNNKTNAKNKQPQETNATNKKHQQIYHCGSKEEEIKCCTFIHEIHE